MPIDVTRQGSVAVVVPSGDLDVSAAAEIKHAIAEFLERGEIRLVMDMNRVAYIDSAGLGALVMAMRRVRMAGGDVRLCALQPDVQSIFEMTRITKALDVFPTREAALASWV